jgi:hypothetical protein
MQPCRKQKRSFKPSKGNMMLEDLNPTIRKFPNTLAEAFPNTVKHEQYLSCQQSIYKDEQASNAEFWVYMTLAFAAGFLVHLIWCVK